MIITFKSSYNMVNSSWPSEAMWLHSNNIGTGNGLVPDGIKLLPEPILTYLQWGINVGIQLSALALDITQCKIFENYIFGNIVTSPSASVSYKILTKDTS